MDVRKAWYLTEQPSFIRRGRSRGRYAAGIRYQRQAQEYLSLLALGRPELELRQNQWVEFLDRSGKRWCELDSLIVYHSARQARIIEIKYQHTVDAWWQLRHLYAPVIEKILPGYQLCLLEVCHWHDPAVAFPERYGLIRNLEEAPFDNSVHVHIYNPKRQPRV